MHVVRVRKQVTYGLVYVLFWMVLIGGGVWLITPSGPAVVAPTPVATAHKPVELEAVDFVMQGQAVDAVARIRNPNARTGEENYSVVFTFTDTDGNQLAEQVVATYLLPGSVQHVVALGVPVAAPVAAVTVGLPEALPSITIQESISLPRFSTTLRQRSTRQVGLNTIEEQTGVVVNNSTFDWQRVEVSAVARDAGGVVVGIGTTFIGGLGVGEQREFSVQWPAPAAATVQVTPLASTNIFREENIIRALGDPGGLR